MLDWKLILERQKKLDSMIKGVRERDLTDIKLSFVAELIEFNETLGINSHKTWKYKEYTREQQLEEFVDCIFFMAQWVNSISIIEDGRNIINNSFARYNMCGMDVNQNTTTVITDTLSQVFDPGSTINNVAEHLGMIASLMRYTGSEIMEAHKNKYEYNLKRIGGEWN